jgi:alpha-tubulin suppressor-like RCC1 family protein
MSKVKITFFLTLFVFLLGTAPTLSLALTPLYVGQSATLSAPDPPGNAALSQTAWSCTNPHVSVEKYMTYGAKVTVHSYFTGTAEVRCDYYYYWYDNYGHMHTNNATTYFQITCNPVTLSISPSNMNLYVGEGQSITYSYNPSTVSPKPTISFISNNTNVATVNDNGYVKAVGHGNAQITIYNSSGPDATCFVEVNAPNPTGISLPKTLSLIVGESEPIPPTVYPYGADCTLTWTSNDNSIATVSSSGLVTGKKAGNVRITATIDGYDYSDYCIVTVEKPSLTLSASPSSGLMEKGSTVALTASNSSAAIYYTLDGSSPSQNSIRYNSPIAINQNLTLKAIAYHDDYKPSDILTAKYEVSSLKVISINPENGATGLGRNIIPSVTFNTPIGQGVNFAGIKLIKNGAIDVDGERIICGNTLHFVSQEELEGGVYLFTIPYNSVTSIYGESNFPHEIECRVEFSGPDIFKVSSNRLLKTDGSLYAWGYFNPNTSTYSGQTKYNYPDPNIPQSLSPFEIFNEIQDYSSRQGNFYVLKTNGSLLGWGGNYNFASSSGQGEMASSCAILGDGTKVSRPTPVNIISGVKSICHGFWHMGAIKKDNSLWMWGRNVCGQIGNGKQENGGQLSPVKVLEDVKDASLGIRHTVALKNDGSVWVWGGRYSIGTSISQSTPLMKMTNAAAISANQTNHVLVLKNDGTVWGFGQNNYGQIGNGTTTDVNSPVKVLSEVKYIEANSDQNIAIREDGSLWRWGDADINSNNYWKSPKKILDNVVVAHANSSKCFALKEDGTLWGMGTYYLGNGTKENSSSMIKIMDNVACFWDFNPIYVLKTDGSLWAWGTGPLGDGTNNYSASPVKIWDAPQKTTLENVEIVTNSTLAANLPVGEKLVFLTKLIPLNGFYDQMTWSIDDENIASISQRGVVTAKSPGSTVMHLEVSGNNNTYTCSHNITVTETSGILNTQQDSMNIHIENSNLCLTNLCEGEVVSVSSISGIVVYYGKSNNGMLNISLPLKGVYILKVGKNTSKIVNR